MVCGKQVVHLWYLQYVSAFTLQVLDSSLHTLVAVNTLQGANCSSGPLNIHTHNLGFGVSLKNSLTCHLPDLGWNQEPYHHWNTTLPPDSVELGHINLIVNITAVEYTFIHLRIDLGS